MACRWHYSRKCKSETDLGKYGSKKKSLLLGFMEKAQRKAYNVAFKLIAIKLVVKVENRATARKIDMLEEPMGRTVSVESRQKLLDNIRH